MTYTTDQYRAVIRGQLAGGEVWANTWSYAQADEDGQAIADAFHAFYVSVFQFCANTSTADSIEITNLGNGESVDVSWSQIVGEDVTPAALPGEVALRVSLSAAGGVRGGPFLGGFSVDACNDSGNITTDLRTAIGGGLDGLHDDLIAAGAFLGINRPELEVVVGVTQARLGRVFDVIRRRRNNISEDYLVVDWP